MKNYRTWELDANDYARFKDLIPPEDAVQITLTGCSNLANKNFLERCTPDADRIFARSDPVVRKMKTLKQELERREKLRARARSLSRNLDKNCGLTTLSM